MGEKGTGDVYILDGDNVYPLEMANIKDVEVRAAFLMDEDGRTNEAPLFVYVTKEHMWEIKRARGNRDVAFICQETGDIYAISGELREMMKGIDNDKKD